MKKFIVYLAIMTFFSYSFLIINSIAQWSWQNPLPQGNSLVCVFFIDKITGWSTGNKGMLLKSTDGGGSWSIQLTGMTKNLGKIHFVNQNTGYILSDTSVYYKTTNGGNNWAFNTLGGNTTLKDVYFMNESTGFISGRNLNDNRGIIYRTTNAGTNWAICLSSAVNSANLPRIDFVSDQIGRVGGGNEYFYYTTNGGTNWAFFNFYGSTDFDYHDTIAGLNVLGGRIQKTTNGGVNWTNCYTSNDTLSSIQMISLTTAYCVGGNRILKTTNFGENWIIQNAGISGYFTKVFFVDSLNGWVSGYAGKMLRTSDGGNNWIAVSSGTTGNLIFSKFNDSNTGYISGSGSILKSTNGGNNWVQQWSLNGDLVLSVNFVNDNTGYAFQPGRLYKTTNGGNNWSFLSEVKISSTFPISYYFYKMHFLNNTTGIIVGSVLRNIGSYSSQEGSIYRTTNSGVNWDYMSNSYVLYYVDISFINENTGWIVGTSGGIIKTTNAGANWIGQTGPFSSVNYQYVSAADSNTVYVTGYGNGLNTLLAKSTNGGFNWTGSLVSMDKNIRKIDFVNRNTGWASGEKGLLYATTNGGTDWFYQPTPTNEHLYVNFLDEHTGWLVGNSGVILKTTSGIVSGIKVIPAVTPSSHMLYQNYPNPFNPVTKIRFQVSESGNVIIKVFDITGKEISTLINDRLQPGTYETTFDGSKLSSGIYFYSINTGDFSQTKKMVLIR